MLTINNSFYELKNALAPLYGEREAVAIAHELISHITGLSKIDRLMYKDQLLTPEQDHKFESSKQALLTGKPLQYVTGSAWFMGQEHFVNEHVLIPRPETEELVMWVITDQPQAPQIIDIGTGSGCIPIALRLNLPDATVTAIDISEEALTVARHNARTIGADVAFGQCDILSIEERDRLGIFDIIVSNPPYIPVKEQANMHSNVKDFEPWLALFVPDDDALLFYRAIAAFGQQHLADNGAIYCELEQNYAAATKELFINAGYSQTEIKQDMHGNWRMLKAKR